MRPASLFAERLGIPVFSNAATGAYQQGLLSRARFTTLVGQSFRIFLDDDQVADLVLHKVMTQQDVALAARDGSAASQLAVHKLAKRWPSPDNCFMLVFHSGSTLVPQDSFVLDHATLGSFAVFLVPGSTTPGRATTIATFNYITAPDSRAIARPVRAESDAI